MLVIAIAATALNFAFRQILIDQAKIAITAASDEIVQTLAANGLFSGEPEPVYEILTSRGYLDKWAGTSAYVQIDNTQGYPIAKSTNMGGLTIPPQVAFPRGSDRRFEIDRLPNDRQLLVLDRLLYAEGSTAVIAVAHVATSLDDVTALVRRARTILIVVTLLGTIGVVIVSFLIARTMIEPIVQLTTAMAEIGSDRLDRRIASTRTDEVGRLAAAFNAMLARLQEAFARERQFISDASHELKTPLTVINANAQMLKRWGTKDPSVRDESIDAIIAESSELASMVTGMLTLAKADSGDQIPKDPLELDRLASDVVAHARDRAARKGLAIEASCQSGPAVVLGDEMLLRQMVTNLVDNAIKFTEQGRIDVMVTAANGRVALTVADTGIGISAATADRLFDRFYRGDSSHSRIIEGTGLGLAIVRSIVRVHNGTVGARPRPDGGSIFQVDLPALEPTVIESQ